MAKSLRSKRRRKMRAIKREKYGQRELEMLKKILPVSDASSSKDSEMKVHANPDIETMDQDPQPGQQFNPKTKQNEHGNYPIWMNSRQIKKQQKKNKRLKTKKIMKKK